MKRIIALLINIFFIVLFSTGCYNYKDINRTLFVTTMVIDIDSAKNSTLYVETFIASRGPQVEAGIEERTILKSTARSLFDAARDLSLSSNYDLNYSQCRAIIFTPKAAKYGLDNFLDMIDRAQELPLRSYVFISSGDIENILNAKMPEEQYVGVFLSELAQNTKLTSKGTVLRIDEFFNNRFIGSRINVINSIDLKKDQKKPRLTITDLVVLKDDKLVDKLAPDEGMALNFLNNTFRRGIINVTNPEHNNHLASIEILKNRTKSDLSYDRNKIHLKKKITCRAMLSFAEKSINITNSEEIKALEDSGKEYIKRICSKLFSDYKEKNIDIFNIQRAFEIQYPMAKVNNLLEITELELDVNVIIKGSTDITDFK